MIRTILLSALIPVLLASLALNWALYTGELGSAHYTYVKVYQDANELTAVSVKQ